MTDVLSSRPVLGLQGAGPRPGRPYLMYLPLEGEDVTCPHSWRSRRTSRRMAWHEEIPVCEMLGDLHDGRPFASDDSMINSKGCARSARGPDTESARASKVSEKPRPRTALCPSRSTTHRKPSGLMARTPDHRHHPKLADARIDHPRVVQALSARNVGSPDRAVSLVIAAIP